MLKGKNYIEKFIIILKSVELTHLTEYSVRSKFKKCYEYLIERENYRECAKLKTIEKDYEKKLKKCNLLKKNIV